MRKREHFIAEVNALDLLLEAVENAADRIYDQRSAESRFFNDLLYLFIEKYENLVDSLKQDHAEQPAETV